MGRHLSPEHRKKISDTLKGKKPVRLDPPREIPAEMKEVEAEMDALISEIEQDGERSG